MVHDRPAFGRGNPLWRGLSGTAPAFGLAAAIRLIPPAADHQTLAELLLQRARFLNQRVEALHERREIVRGERPVVSHGRTSSGAGRGSENSIQVLRVKQSRFKYLAEPLFTASTLPPYFEGGQ